MTQPKHNQRVSAVAWAARLAVAALLWWVLDEGRADGWWFGALWIALALAFTARFPVPASPWRWSMRGWLAFIPYFVAQALKGGWDVARRALAPSLPIEPRMVTYRTGLDTEGARIFLAHVVSLLPGTVSCDLDGDRIEIHALAGGEQEVRRDTEDLERRVAAVFAGGTRT